MYAAFYISLIYAVCSLCCSRRLFCFSRSVFLCWWVVCSWGVSNSKLMLHLVSSQHSSVPHPVPPSLEASTAVSHQYLCWSSKLLILHTTTPCYSYLCKLRVAPHKGKQKQNKLGQLGKLLLQQSWKHVKTSSDRASPASLSPKDLQTQWKDCGLLWAMPVLWLLGFRAVSSSLAAESKWF